MKVHSLRIDNGCPPGVNVRIHEVRDERTNREGTVLLTLVGESGDTITLACTPDEASMVGGLLTVSSYHAAGGVVNLPEPSLVIIPELRRDSQH